MEMVQLEMVRDTRRNELQTVTLQFGIEISSHPAPTRFPCRVIPSTNAKPHRGFEPVLGSTALKNWGFLSNPSQLSPGEFQYLDASAAKIPQRSTLKSSGNEGLVCQTVYSKQAATPAWSKSCREALMGYWLKRKNRCVPERG
jgi:hypothetical protein